MSHILKHKDKSRMLFSKPPCFLHITNTVIQTKSSVSSCLGNNSMLTSYGLGASSTSVQTPTHSTTMASQRFSILSPPYRPFGTIHTYLDNSLFLYQKPRYSGRPQAVIIINRRKSLERRQYALQRNENIIYAMKIRLKLLQDSPKKSS